MAAANQGIERTAPREIAAAHVLEAIAALELGVPGADRTLAGIIAADEASSDVQVRSAAAEGREALALRALDRNDGAAVIGELGHLLGTTPPGAARSGSSPAWPGPAGRWRTRAGSCSLASVRRATASSRFLPRPWNASAPATTLRCSPPAGSRADGACSRTTCPGPAQLGMAQAGAAPGSGAAPGPGRAPSRICSCRRSPSSEHPVRASGQSSPARMRPRPAFWARSSPRTW